MSAMHKYPLPVADVSTVVLPPGARVRHFGAHGLELFVWALVDPAIEPFVEHEYRIFGTGHSIPDSEDLVHRATVVMENGLVWHIFEDVPF